MLTLEQVIPGASVIVEKVGGARAFRRRLMELGMIPGTPVKVLRIAPFGDPMELTARGCNLSIRAAEAREVQVTPLAVEQPSAVPAIAARPGLAKSVP
jgi:ferrous iron transport protein A